MSDWDEIKKLAADFQQVQTNETLNKISERNVIDIVKKLIDLKLINVIFSTDGKEFITLDHLRKEIEDEVYINGGRIHLSELASTLKVDHQHIVRTANDLVREKSDEYTIILGQLIHSNYKHNLADQIGSWVLAHEQLSIADFAKKLDLPSEFLLDMVKDILPKVVDEFVVSSDGRTFYTADLINRYKSMVVGALSAISRPINLNSISKRLDLPEKMFISLVEESIKEGRLKAILEDRLFTPNIYIRKQNEYIEKFFASNSYIEYDMITRLDIKQPKAFLKRRFPQGLALDTCYIGHDLVTQVEGLIESIVPTGGWIDISAIIPPAIQPDDIEMIVQSILKRADGLREQCLMFGQTVVCSKAFIESCRTQMSKRMADKASKDLQLGKLMKHFFGNTMKKKAEEDKKVEDDSSRAKVERPVESERQVDDTEPKESEDILDDPKQDKKKSKDKKTGGGFTGREVKQKAVKKKYLPGNKAASKVAEQQEEGGKAPRSNKGRAARRALSPDGARTGNVTKAPEPKEPLTFMSCKEISNQLRVEMRGDFEFPDEFLDQLASGMEDELNLQYEKFAKVVLDEHLAKANEEDGQEEEIELVQ